METAGAAGANTPKASCSLTFGWGLRQCDPNRAAGALVRPASGAYRLRI